MPELRLRALATTLLTAAAAAVALAACGDDSTGSAAATSTTATQAAAKGAATVDLADSAPLGTKILVDAEGRTLYLFRKDDEADESYCSGPCAKAWPPLTVKGDASAGPGIDADRLTTFEREDGTIQVAFADHPLYLYAGDQAPGEANGNGIDQFGAEWYAVDSSGAAVESEGPAGEDDPGPPAAADETGSSYGY